MPKDRRPVEDSARTPRSGAQAQGAGRARIAEPPRPHAARYAAVDMLRGFAIALMFVYHFTFDLNYFGVVRFDFNHDWRWLAFRAVIVSLFLGLVGVSLVLADAKRFNWRSYGRRLVALVACATAASLGSYLMFPATFIFFGILHFILVASVLGLAFLRFQWINLVAALLLLAVGLTLQHTFFDQPAWQWFGLMTHKPHTEDYVPLLPWFGVVLLGMFLGRLALASSWNARIKDWRPASSPSRLLALAGRHSLLIYMVHQPIFIVSLYLVFKLSQSGL
jgi:uncharacterized membrane protein